MGARDTTGRIGSPHSPPKPPTKCIGGVDGPPGIGKISYRELWRGGWLSFPFEGEKVGKPGNAIAKMHGGRFSPKAKHFALSSVSSERVNRIGRQHVVPTLRRSKGRKRQRIVVLRMNGLSGRRKIRRKSTCDDVASIGTSRIGCFRSASHDLGAKSGVRRVQIIRRKGG